MRQVYSAATSLLFVLAATHTGRADKTWEYSVQLNASVQVAPAQITLSWPQDSCVTPKSYTLFRKAPGANSWGIGATLSGTATSFTDTNVTVGTDYEYQIVKRTPQYSGYGYLYTGISVPPIENRGTLLLVVDKTHAAELSNELSQLEQDLIGDGWVVTRLDINRTDSVVTVKNQIKSLYNADPENVKALFLFGHVPVPYSGNLVPDGHMPDHQGAWPCDGYYGDMDGVWTDALVNERVANDSRTRNVPGDGKFDQSTFPAPLKLMVGRVDLANMPGRMTWGGPATFPSEVELLRNYLNKDHRFRHKQFDLPRRGVVGDYFGVRNGEAFAASGWRNLAALIGPTNITTLPDQGTWIPTLRTNECLWAYGCGSGSYTSIGGLGNTDIYHDGITTELMAADVKAVFTLLFGSWLGDWDSEDNMQRAILALPSYGLTCAWSGRPHWFLHHMALGEPIGFGARLTQNNGAGGLYQNQLNSCAGQTHIALMGDPTLRMHVVAPPTNLQAETNGNMINLTWDASADSIAGYHVYRSFSSNGPFARLTTNLITTTAFTDINPPPVSTYLVRAVKLEVSASGSYYNPSQGAFVTANGGGAITGNGTNPKETNSPTVKAIESASNATAAGSSLVVSAQPLRSSNAWSKASAKIGPKLISYNMDWNPTFRADGVSTLTPVGQPNSVLWVDDSLPAGAAMGVDGGDVWNWVNSNPAPLSGTRANQSAISAGLHQHYFTGASSTLAVPTGAVLFAYAYLDPANPPSELMLQWYNGSWEHRAYWGANRVTYGADGSAGRRYMGALPPAGQWVRLEVPAAQVDLDGATLNGMAFTQFGGRATWDYAGQAVISNDTGSNPTPTPTNNPPLSTNTVPGGNGVLSASSGSLPGVSSGVDYVNLELPKVGSNALHILTPTLLELKLINTKQPDPAHVTQWDLVGSNFEFFAPAINAFAVTVNGQPVAVSGIGFKRRPIYAPLAAYDLRIENSLYLQLATPISDNQSVEVKNPTGTLWTGNLQFIAQADTLRFNPAIHVNQHGYLPNYPKKAMVGYYAGSLGEVTIPTSGGFKLVDAGSGIQVYQGTLVQRADVGYVYSPTPYQKVYEADFTSFNTPGEYRLIVPGMGGSLPFTIDDGVGLAFARAYALGLYHQRCGTNNTLPYTRHTHDVCHTAQASVIMPASSYSFTWNTISNYTRVPNSDGLTQIAPALTGPAAQLFPFVRQGTLDVSGGHHDAGDYSKYTANSASFIHYLMFAVDSLPGVAALDNLGLPESGDGISDVMQEAKWEADFLAKIQDTDGGFYFLVYPRNREYEAWTLPEHGDPQIVWPKTTSVTAAAVAALAQCASSPLFKQTYPAAAALYLQKAQLGWQFLNDAIDSYGKNGAYQKITHYADDFLDQDELAWAACQMYLATTNSTTHQQLLSWFDPANPATFRWGWWRMCQGYGHAIRSYAFAAQSGRLPAAQLDSSFLSKCRSQITAAGDDVLRWSGQSAYGTSFPEETKHVRGAGWYFSSDQAFDLTVAYQLNGKADYLTALLANMNYEGGCNPVNVSYITGLGWKRQRDIVNQYAPIDRQALPPSGLPVGNVQGTFSYLYSYQGDLEKLCFPSDNAEVAPYPYYDRWGDSWNTTAEFVILNSARSLASLGFLAARSSLKTQPWRPIAGQITVPNSTVAIGTPVTAFLTVPGMDLSSARITWEARDQEPTFGPSYTFSPKNSGAHWVEAEALWPDGRRVFATAQFNANAPNVVWADDELPPGVTAGGDGGDSWNWVTSNPPPFAGAKAHQSNIAPGSHQHYFVNSSATLPIGTGDLLYAYVYLDPNNLPSEVMLQWYAGNWEHRAYWGGNSLAYGTPGTPSRRYMGPLPAAGQWVQLKIPANQVNLEGATVTGMAFTLYGGRATWDSSGRLSSVPSTPAPGPRVSLTLGGSGPSLQWNSIASHRYRVSYKNQLGDPNWTALTDVIASGSTTSWTDASAVLSKQRFYIVTQLD